MPMFDRTGPMGGGPMSGKGFGPCGFGLGWRRHFGIGRGMGRYFSDWIFPESTSDKLAALAKYKEALREELQDVEKEEEELNKSE